MGYLKYNELTLRNKKNSDDELKQFLKAYGFDVKKEYNNAYCEIELDDGDLDELYNIASRLFENVNLYYHQHEEHSVTDWYSGYEVEYNEKYDGMKEIKEYDYCYGEGTVGGENVWDLIKEECEKEAKVRNIKIEWDKNEDDFWPNSENEEFDNLCDEILEKHGGLEGLGTKICRKKIPITKIDNSIIQKIADNAGEQGYVSLIDRIKEKFSVEPKVIIKKEEKEEFNEDDLEKYEKILLENVYNFSKLPKKIQEDKKFILKLMKKYKSSFIYELLSENMKKDKEIALCAISIDTSWSTLNCMSQELKNDKDIVKKCLANVKYPEDYFKIVGDQIKDDKDFVMELINKYEGIYKNASSRLKKDKDVANLAFFKYGEGGEYADVQTITREDAMKVMSKNGNQLKNLPDEMKNDREIVLCAVKKNWCAIEYASDELKKDKEIILCAVKENACAIEYVDDEIKNDIEYMKILYKKINKVYENIFLNNLPKNIKNILKKEK